MLRQFATELVASVILKTAREKQNEVSEAAIAEFIHRIFDDATDQLAVTR